MDAVTSLHFTAATIVDDELIDETIAVGTRGGLLVGYKINDSSEHLHDVRFSSSV